LILGDYIPIQIVESKKLNEDENLWLNALRDGLKVHTMNAILEGGKQRAQESNIDAYLSVILRANDEILTEVDKMWQETLAEIIEEKGMWPILAERFSEKNAERNIEKGKEIMARNLLRMGMSVEEIAQAAELPVEKIRFFENSE
jgi:predicted transposase YdaD